MAFPHDDRIVEELLKYIARQPGGRIHGPQSYEPLADAFPELTPDDRKTRVPTGELRWESKVRFARLKLVERGLLFPAKEGPDPKRGIWIATGLGRQVAAGAPVPIALPRGQESEREGVILGWNRSLWDGWDETYEGVVNMLMAGATYKTRWSVGHRRDLAPGTDAWLLRQGGPYGLLGHGVVASEPFEEAHFARPGETSRYVDVEFDVLVNEEDILRRDELEREVPEVAWRHQFQSGNRVAADANARLRRLWNDYIS